MTIRTQFSRRGFSTCSKREASGHVLSNWPERRRVSRYCAPHRRRGTRIGNHTWNHPQLTKLSPAALREEIDRTSSTIAEIIGKPLRVMRPPYGATSDYINHWMNREFAMKVILWSVDPLDWKYRNSARVERQILAGAQPGVIILSHDIHAPLWRPCLTFLIASSPKAINLSLFPS